MSSSSKRSRREDHMREEGKTSFTSSRRKRISSSREKMDSEDIDAVSMSVSRSIN